MTKTRGSPALRDDEVGEGLVIGQADVEGRLDVLDEPGLASRASTSVSHSMVSKSTTRPQHGLLGWAEVRGGHEIVAHAVAEPLALPT